MTPDDIPPPLATRSVGNPKTAAKPDWSYWANLASVPISAAVYLSIDIDPRSASNNVSDAETRREVKRRGEIAQNHLDAGLLPSELTDSDVSAMRKRGGAVKLADFRAWGEALDTPFSFPEKFPSLRASLNIPPQTSSMKSRERNNLLRVIRALDSMNPAPLPQKGYAESLRAAITALELTAPSDDTIRKIIEAARDLDS